MGGGGGKFKTSAGDDLFFLAEGCTTGSGSEFENSIKETLNDDLHFYQISW